MQVHHIWSLSQARIKEKNEWKWWNGAQLDGRCVCLCYLPLHHKSPEDFFWHQLTPVARKMGHKMVVCVCVLLILLNTIIKGTETVQATPLRRTLIFSLIRMRYLPSVLWHCWLGGRKGIQPVKKYGGWWRWALVILDGVAPSRMVSVSASVNLPLQQKVQKFSPGTGSPGWSRKKVT